MTREEAISLLDSVLHMRSRGYYTHLEFGGKQDKAEEEFLDSMGMAIAALREQESLAEKQATSDKRYTAHDVACILAEFTGDDCACNFNGIDEWLPEKCELMDACPYPVGVACWEQYLKHKEDNDGR